MNKYIRVEILKAILAVILITFLPFWYDNEVR